MLTKTVFWLSFLSIFQLNCAQDDIIVRQYPEPESEVRGRNSKDPKCTLDQSELPNLQVLFLVDSGLPDPWVRIQREMTQEITRLLKQEYKDRIEFATASHNNWEKDCYKMLHDFTKDESIIVSAVNSVPSDPSSDVLSEGSLTMSLVMAMMDKNLHWIRDMYTLSKTNTRKYVVMFPVRTSTVILVNPTGRKPPKGDGTDNCQNSLPPSGEFIKYLQDREKFFIFMGGYQPIGHPDPNALMNFYYRQLKMLGGGNANTFWVTSNAGLNPEVMNPDAAVHGKSLFDNIVKEHKVCEWTDPEPYITLGV